ncbi:hypothetical protein BOTBODRAFT_158191 [Botryobasidium botryosum FD-172 SS1]|uniref:RRM domain-containing protein n=1 Tax=Botryobasidium botryosum (strain FD-172 SS1) TaxID=930990 RepID=A0A067MIP2_BOTB1|nr:hypothetical protein BOTBODRAFT_158191 [Botryobasidium botryosum FD-172 SS1]
MGLPQAISGFSVVPIKYSSSARHYLYVRSHENGASSSKSGSAALPDKRTLFIVNLPPDATQREISLFFKPCGTVERVVFGRDNVAAEEGDEEEDAEGEWVPPSERQEEEEEEDVIASSKPAKKRRSKDSKAKDQIPTITPLPSLPDRTLRQTGHSAHVVFLDESSLARALAFVKTASTSKKHPAWPPADTSAPEPSGLAYYLALHAALHPPLTAVRAHADTSVELYEYNLAKNKVASKYKKGEAIVDEDGFTLVTRGGAYGKTLGGGVGVASKKFDPSAQEKKKKNKKEKERFYTFQLREKKRQEFMDLRQKFEEDKKKIAQLKESRRFRPY